MTILIKNGRLINPKTKFDGITNILIEEDKIVSIEEKLENISNITDETTIIDGEGWIVSPGFIDLHVHLREPGYGHKETIETGTSAAAKGGFTTVACMPNTNPALDDGESIELLNNMLEADAVIRVKAIGAITKNIAGKEKAKYDEMKRAGIIGLSDDGRTTMDNNFMKEAFLYANENNMPVLTHCEDHEISSKYTKEVYPRVAEYKIVQRDIDLAKEYDGEIHICHISTIESKEIIEKAKEENVKVTCEVCPHHFALSDEIIDIMDPYSKVNPPIRSKEDRLSLIEGIRSGAVDIIATDHAPHERESKETSYENASYGISGIEIAFPVAYKSLCEEAGISINRIIEMLTSAPAKIARLDSGSIEIGKKADIVLIDLSKESTVDPEEFVSKGKNTPFKGYKTKSEIQYTICDGNIVYKK